MKKCKHKSISTTDSALAGIHPDRICGWVVETCEECGAMRIAEVEYYDDTRTMMMTTLSALPWRQPEEDA